MASSTTPSELLSNITNATNQTEALYQTWLQKKQLDQALAIQLMRTLHTIRGLAQMIQLGQVAALTQTYEAAIDNLVRHTIQFSPQLASILSEMQSMLQTIATKGQQSEQIIAALQQKLTSNLPATHTPTPPKQPPASLTVDLTVLGLALDDVDTLTASEKHLIKQAWHNNQTIVGYCAHIATQQLERDITTITHAIEKQGSLIATVPTVAKMLGYDYAFVFLFTCKQPLTAITASFTNPGTIIAVSTVTTPQTITIQAPLHKQPAPCPQQQKPTPLPEQNWQPTPRSLPLPTTTPHPTVPPFSYDKLKTTLLKKRDDHLLPVPLVRIDNLITLYNRLIASKTCISALCKKIKYAAHELNTNIAIDEQLARLDAAIRQSQEELLGMRLVRAETICPDLIQLIQSLAQTQGKQIAVVVNGKEIAMDTSILDSLYNPLTHILRNAIQHGIATPEQREKSGKPAQGTITITFDAHDHHAIVSINDDGQGIDVDVVKKKAIALGLIDATTAPLLNNQQAYEFIFYPGFSTQNDATQTSDRGVGMNAIKDIINKMRGTISIESGVGTGTTVTMTIPSRLPLQRLLHFTVNSYHFALPFSAITEIERCNPQAFQQNKGYLLYAWHDKLIRALILKDLLGMPEDQTPASHHSVLILGQAPYPIALLVDSVVGQEELIVWPLPPDNHDIFDYYAGHADFGDDKLVIILHSDKLFETVAHEKSINKI